MTRPLALRLTKLVGTTLALTLLFSGNALGADVVVPTEGQTVSTRTPTVVIQLDVTTELDGKPRDYFAPGGPTYAFLKGGTTDGSSQDVVVALPCKEAGGAGRFECADPQKVLPNGIYFVQLTYNTHTCFQSPPIGSFQLPPVCTFTVGLALSGLFNLYVAPVRAPPPAKASGGGGSASNSGSSARSFRSAATLLRSSTYGGTSVKNTKLSAMVYSTLRVVAPPKTLAVACWSPTDWLAVTASAKIAPETGSATVSGFHLRSQARWLHLSPRICQQIQ